MQLGAKLLLSPLRERRDLAALGALILTGALCATGFAFGADTAGDATGASPTILRYLPEAWKPIDEEQVFLLQLKAVPISASIEANAYCTIDNDAERVPIKVLLGSDREEVLTALDQSDEAIAVVRCSSRLPSDSRVKLHWGAGIAASSGQMTQTDEALEFHVRKPFTISVPCGPGPKLFDGCNPNNPIRVGFNAPVPRAQALAFSLVSANGSVFPPVISEDPVFDGPLAYGIFFKGPFPENSSLTLSLPGNLADVAGRKPANAAQFPYQMHIGVSPPFTRSFGVLESKQGGVLPIAIRNFDSWSSKEDGSIIVRLLRVDSDSRGISTWFRRVEEINRFNSQCIEETEPINDGPQAHWSSGRDGTFCFVVSRQLQAPNGNASVFRTEDARSTFTVTKPSRDQNEWPGIALRAPGFYIVELETKAPTSFGRGQVRYVATSALVTDLAVHFQWGVGSSIVWVTRLSDGLPIAGAEVAVSDHCTGQLLWKGQTNREGIATVKPLSGEPYSTPGCDGGLDGKFHPYLITAKRGRDFSFGVATRSMGLASSAANPDSPYNYSYHYGGFQVEEGIWRKKRALAPLGKEASTSQTTPDLMGNEIGPPVTIESKALKIGLRDEGEMEPFGWRVGVVASTPDGRRAPGLPIVAKFYNVVSAVGPERSVGGFDSFWDTRVIKELQSCRGLSDSQGQLSCALSPREVTGIVVVRAEAHDASGQIAGADLMPLRHPNSGSELDILPEKSHPLHTGETAHFKIHTPFTTATALVTVTREGQFVRSFIKRLSGESAIVEVPILSGYSPEVLVTMLVVGRCANGAGDRSRTNEIWETRADSTQPAYRLGAAAINIKTEAHTSSAMTSKRGETLSLAQMPMIDRLAHVYATAPPSNPPQP